MANQQRDALNEAASNETSSNKCVTWNPLEVVQSRSEPSDRITLRVSPSLVAAADNGKA